MNTPSGVIQVAQQLSVETLRFNAFQGILFTSTQIPTARILGRLLEKFGDRFNGAPTVLPIPLEINPEIPRIILQSEDRRWGLEVGLARINFRWGQMTDDQQLQPTEFRDHFLRFVEGLLQIEPGMQIGRLAYALTRYVLSETPASLIAERLCKDRIVQKPNLENLEVHVHTRKRLANTFEVNEWTRFKSGTLNLPNTPSRKIALVEQDINTLAENAATTQFIVDDVRRFTESSSREVAETLRSLLEN